MSFCSKCGSKASKEDTYCPKCGVKSTEGKEPVNSTATSSVNQNSTPSGKSGTGWSCAILGCGCLFLIIAGIIVIFALATLGVKGQPGTIIQPSSIKTPKNLVATAVDSSINLRWQKSDSSEVAKYNVYKSTSANKDFQKLASLENNAGLQYQDAKVEKGVTYYYVVTAVASSSTESGNSNETSYTLTSAPLLPNGVQTWQDVLTKFDADSKYAELFKKITKLDRADIEKFINLQNKGKSLKKKLAKGSVITNTTENYKILPNYTLNEDKWFLIDDKGIPRVMIWCGNPIKLIDEMTAGEKLVQSMQTISYDIIYVFPVSVTNVIIYASQPINSVLDNFSPDAFGPVSIDEEFVDGLVTPTSELQAGQQWAVEGKILVEADPHDPAPGETVTMTVTLNPAEANVAIEYEVNGTDGYNASNTATTDSSGKIQFTIPGGAGGIVDTIKVKVPSKNLEGSTSYTF